MGEDAPQSLHWHEHRRSLVLDQEHNEFCRLGLVCAPTNDMNIVGAFIKGLSWSQRHFFSAFQLHDDGALQHVYKCVCIVTRNHELRELAETKIALHSGYS